MQKEYPTMDAYQLPVLLQAWQEALTADGQGHIPPQLQKYLTSNPQEQKEILRELYMFLLAQQLVAITSRLDCMACDQRKAVKLQRKAVNLAKLNNRKNGWFSKFGGWPTIATAVGVVVSFGGLALWRTHGR